MSAEEKRQEQLCRYWLWAIALLHLVCLLLRPAPERQVATSSPTHYASVVVNVEAPRL